MNVFDFLKFSVEEEHKAINKLLSEMTEEALKFPMGDDVTIFSRLKHMSSAEYRMAAYLYSTGDDEEFDIEEESINSLQKGFARSKNRHLLTLNNLSEIDLEKMWKSKVSGNEYSYKFLLWHFLEHLATHRGQVAYALRQYLG
ncbi:MAG: DUF664 domain-containing protein [Candidatus Heimdallarchaeota archaeon]|nr:DUF664 domain-containing protein [Candidatus Heimdallarchaeota archaeon]